MNKVLDRIFDFLAVVIGLILVFMTLSIGYAIFVRAVNLPGPLWIVQFNEYAMLFATFLGGAWLLSKGKHVSIELVVSRFSLRTQKIFDLIHSLLGMGLCAILCWYGALTTLENFQRKVIHVQAVDVPMAYVLFVIPLGFFFLVLQFSRNFVVGVNELRNLGLRVRGNPGRPVPQILEPGRRNRKEAGISMEWWMVLIFFLGGLIILLLAGFPVAFAFLLMDVLGILVFMGAAGLKNITLGIFSSLSIFTITPVPLFILMGELMYHSHVADIALDIMDRWLGRVPGRLGVLAAVSGTIFAATSGSTMANTAMLGTVLLPEMRKRGYSVSMSVGPIIGVRAGWPC